MKLKGQFSMNWFDSQCKFTPKLSTLKYVTISISRIGSVEYKWIKDFSQSRLFVPIKSRFRYFTNLDLGYTSINPKDMIALVKINCKIIEKLNLS